MSKLEDYSTYIGDPLMLTLCLKEDSILVSSSIMEIFGNPKRLQFMMNDEKCLLLVRVCEDPLEGMVVVPAGKPHFDVSGIAIADRIKKATGWKDDTPRMIQGEFIPKMKAVLFDLLMAQPADLQLPLEGHGTIH